MSEIQVTSASTLFFYSSSLVFLPSNPSFCQCLRFILKVILLSNKGINDIRKYLLYKIKMRCSDSLCHKVVQLVILNLYSSLQPSECHSQSHSWLIRTFSENKGMPLSKGNEGQVRHRLQKLTKNTPTERLSVDQVVRSELSTGKTFQKSKVGYLTYKHFKDWVQAWDSVNTVLAQHE